MNTINKITSWIASWFAEPFFIRRIPAQEDNKTSYAQDNDAGSRKPVMQSKKLAPDGQPGLVERFARSVRALGSYPLPNPALQPKNTPSEQRGSTTHQQDRLSNSSRLPPSRFLSGGRVSVDNNFESYSNGIQSMAAFSRQSYWLRAAVDNNFDINTFNRIDLSELAELLADLSPEVSAALWYYLLMCNSGFTVRVFKPDSEEVDQKAQKYLDECRRKIGLYNGSENVFYDKFFMQMFLRGGMFGELVIDENGKDFVDIANPDPKTLTFRRRFDDKRGWVWDFGQWQKSEWVSLDIETCRYIPVHPFPGRLEGRSLVSSVFFVSIFLMSVLRDLKRVIQQQGYMRLDIAIDFEKVRAEMPAETRENPEAWYKWCSTVIDEISSYYSQLEPDDAYVHNAATTVNSNVGTANVSSLGAMDALFQVLERMSARALKTMPLMFGNAEGASEANANRQFEFYQKGIETVQRNVESGLEYFYDLALQAGGYLANSQVRFAQMRASEALRDAQTEFLKAKIARYLYDCGYISQDEAAQIAAEREMADAPEPRNTGDTNTDGITQLNPEASATRQLSELGLSHAEISNLLRGAIAELSAKPPSANGSERTPTTQELTNTLNLWQQFAPEEAKDLLGSQATN